MVITLRRAFKNVTIIALVILYLPGLSPRTTFPFTKFSITKPKKLEGALEPNHRLDGAERLLEGRVFGPECLIAKSNEIYTGLRGGNLARIILDGSKDGQIAYFAKTGRACDDIFQFSLCGLLLGLAFDSQGNNLIVADGFLGIWEVDLDTNNKSLLVSTQQELPGQTVNRPGKLFNGVAVSSQGNIYWTDSMSDDLLYAVVANPSGRLFRYNRANNVIEVLLDGLFLANGVALSPDEDFIVVAETAAMRLTKFYLKGPKAGQSEIFVDGLPGLPDNLTPDAEGIWVPLVISVDNRKPNLFAILAPYPLLRNCIARLLAMLLFPLRFVNSLYSNKVYPVAFRFFIKYIQMHSARRTTVVRVDWNGKIVDSLHGFDSTASGISHVLELDEYLYLGSSFNNYLLRIKNPYEKNKTFGANWWW
ncbi:adipocyte plasma membrane-associated protein [Drosophila pseudoobscura]|uniref:Adipocyte plasma membrane-associated protein n=1 Tax=Drosophila pseudoobscura pseudoobscura TaxID=46245 RepID=A0A6I8V2T9_DROPS|nr:adipocyte plasma membrane-associated protein [Drosophila pseudoobscura]XP_015037327.2 adipocyte plasma membrane-associated protein [Drosophila pseudoobscura]